MENPLFRKKSMERISSPEQLQDYMRVTSPGIWMVLTAVIVLLVGGIICSAMGRLETTRQVEAVVDEQIASIRLPLNGQEEVQKGMPMRLGGRETEIAYLYISEDGWPVASALIDLPDGRYDAEIVIDSIAPISFLLND